MRDAHGDKRGAQHFVIRSGSVHTVMVYVVIVRRDSDRFVEQHLAAPSS